jgi:uncharacterized protein
MSREGNPFRPFCSERCKMIDLDHWLEGRYRVPAPFTEDDTDSHQTPDAKVESE